MTLRTVGRTWRLTTLLAIMACSSEEPTSTALPAFTADPSWPADIPSHWVFGPGTGIYVDADDHVWLLHRPERITDEDMMAAAASGDPDCCEKAPPLIEVDPDGSIVATYGTIDRSENWPYFPHGVFVDHNDFVWVGNAPHHTIMKFTRSGEHQFTIGTFDQTAGSHSTDLLGGAADFWVNPSTNELFVADGYDNRRIAVFDAESGSFLRQWGAYGRTPDDEYTFDSASAGMPPLPEQFDLVHGLTGSSDGLLYVADATASRIQVFEFDGTFVRETSIDGRMLPARITDVALSTDPGQEWLYVSDGRDDKVWILRRADLTIVGQFGRTGSGWGEFGRPHNIATDSHGNIYVAEAHPGRRFQKFSIGSQ